MKMESTNSSPLSAFSASAASDLASAGSRLAELQPGEDGLELLLAGLCAREALGEPGSRQVVDVEAGLMQELAGLLDALDGLLGLAGHARLPFLTAVETCDYRRTRAGFSSRTKAAGRYSWVG